MNFAFKIAVLCCIASGNLLPSNDAAFAAEKTSLDRPNVLMIVVDDLNDWVEPLGGHPQVKTPHMAALAARGVNFTNAHCQSPLCNSSRTSAMTSLRPSTTGIYGLSPWFRGMAEHKDTVSLPQHFSKAGYRTYTAGKVYHNSMGRHPSPGVAPEFDNWGPGGGPGMTPPQKLVPPTPAGNNPWVDWGVFDHPEEKKGDWIVADWAEKTIAEIPASGDQPFFLACGFFLPHVPCHTTQKWWDMYPEETLVMPPRKDNERAGCSPFSWYLHWNLPEPRVSWLEHYGEHKNLVRAYLACTSFVDSQIGRVLTALENSPMADNTIVVLWSDHGWHLGEKEMTGKTTLWERSTHVPLIFAGPGIQPGVCGQPAELLDVFPTLADLAGLPVPDFVEGVSLKPQIDNPSHFRARPAITDHNPGNTTVRDDRYRLIRYADGSEELYDLQNDPSEFENLIADPASRPIADRLRKHVRTDMAPLAAGSGQRILERRDDGWYWEGKKIDPDNPPMSIGSTPKESLPRLQSNAAGG